MVATDYEMARTYPQFFERNEGTLRCPHGDHDTTVHVYTRKIRDGWRYTLFNSIAIAPVQNIDRCDVCSGTIYFVVDKWGISDGVRNMDGTPRNPGSASRNPIPGVSTVGYVPDNIFNIYHRRPTPAAPTPTPVAPVPAIAPTPGPTPVAPVPAIPVIAPTPIPGPIPVIVPATPAIAPVPATPGPAPTPALQGDSQNLRGVMSALSYLLYGESNLTMLREINKLTREDQSVDATFKNGGRIRIDIYADPHYRIRYRKVKS